MSKESSVEQAFHRIHLLIAEGQADMALAALAQISASDASQTCEVAYIRAWCATLSGNWDAAATFLLSTDSARFEDTDLQTLGQTERRRRIHYLLLLGQMANTLGYYEEATRHYTQCIKFLDERRMNILSVRIKARCGLGSAYTQIGFYAVALAHYEDALQLSGARSAHPDILEIYAGLCTVQRCLGNIEQALLYGKKALQLCVERSETSLEGRMHNLLGQVYDQMRDFEQASFHYTEALKRAKGVDDPELILTNLTALAGVHLAEGRLEEARCLYEQGLTYRARVSNTRLTGALYIMGGKIAEAGQVSGGQTQALVAEAIACYQKAETALAPIQAKTELAEVYGRLAQILEASGRQGEAIAYWKSAYTLYARPEESPVT